MITYHEAKDDDFEDENKERKVLHWVKSKHDTIRFRKNTHVPINDNEDHIIWT